MNSLCFSVSDKGVVVTGKTFDVKEILKEKGATWDSDGRVWIFRGQVDPDAVKLLVQGAIEALVAEKKAARKVELTAAKKHREWLKTPEGQAYSAAEAKARVIAARASDGGFWICCDDCTVIDWGRRHTFCKHHEFRVRGMVYTGD